MTIAVAIITFLLALGITLYPIISSRYNEQHQSEIHVSYQEQVEQADTAAIDEARELAIQYNQAILEGVKEDAFDHEALLWASEDYKHQLNITGNGINTNLFFGDSPFKPFPTDFLYLTTSTDGLTWSEPKLLNLKEASEQTLLIGPGNGTYDEASGRVIFTAYRHTGGASGTAYECTSLIWMDSEGNWYRSEDATYNNSNKSSEATAVVLEDGTVRVFYRSGSTTLCYTDYLWVDGAYVRDERNTSVSTEAVKNAGNGCMLTAIKYTKKINGFRATKDQKMENVNEVRRLLRDLYKPQQVIFSQTILK